MSNIGYDNDDYMQPLSPEQTIILPLPLSPSITSDLPSPISLSTINSHKNPSETLYYAFPDSITAQLNSELPPSKELTIKTQLENVERIDISYYNLYLRKITPPLDIQQTNQLVAKLIASLEGSALIKCAKMLSMWIVNNTKVFVEPLSFVVPCNYEMADSLLLAKLVSHLENKSLAELGIEINYKPYIAAHSLYNISSILAFFRKKENFDQTQLPDPYAFLMGNRESITSFLMYLKVYYS